MASWENDPWMLFHKKAGAGLFIHTASSEVIQQQKSWKFFPV
jgi:hypothetical protein